MNVVEVRWIRDVSLAEQDEQLFNIFLVEPIERLTAIITVRDTSNRLNGGEALRILFHHVVVLIGLGKAHRPKQLPFGWIVAPLQRV